MSRKPTPGVDDLELWTKVAETVKPLKPRPPRQAARDAPAPKPAPPSPVARVAVPPPIPKAPPALASLDRRTRSRVARGAAAIDRRVDLHGLTQAAAERRLGIFLEDAQADAARLVLVITGKGKAGEERGVLRRMVPLWLASPRWRHLVVGFEEAAPNHGGAGALYVRIRRPR